MNAIIELMAKKTLPPKSADLSKWYLEVISKAKLADYSPVKGCIVMRPAAFGIWEQIKQLTDAKFRQMGVENAYFPLFIPHEFLEKEAKHVEGFAPELAIVTHAGGKKLADQLVVRPTSETIMYAMYAKWISSWRDLPLKLNQWNNVVRWEKRTYFFLRTTEFLWQECHTAHATHQESREMMLQALFCYQYLAQEVLAMPVIIGYKSESERFAGASETTTMEALMPDGKALQAGTSHDLGQNFSQKSAFNIAFQDAQGKTDYVWQTSFGITTRLIGALIMTHGDDDGLVLPPLVAPTQVEIILVKNSPAISDFGKKIITQLEQAGVHYKLNNDEHNSLGYRLNEAELRGTPILIVVGDNEVATGQLTLKIRHNQSQQEIALKQLSGSLPALFAQIQKEMLAKAQARLESQTHEVSDYQEFKEIMLTKRGFIKAYWCGCPECEQAIKDETKATTRCLPIINEKGDTKQSEGKCIYCGKKAKQQWLFAQAY